MKGLTHAYTRLPAQCFAEVTPTPVADPALVMFNRPLADELGLDADLLSRSADLFAGNVVADGSRPLAMAYAGHQFGQFVPQLGDGRALLLGEVIDRTGQVREIQLKGSGPTPFSRGGDGRAALGPVLREYLVSEAMHALGVPTTRALAAVTTGESVLREGPIPGGILTRVADSHLRVGTFQYFAARQDIEAIRSLVAFAIQRHFSEAAGDDNPPLALLRKVQDAQARLVALWMSVGFIHGVMNTDNMALGGQTIDYGPCAFMDRYDPQTVFSSIDHGGRYAYARQPAIAQWNLARFAETLIPLLDDDEERAVAMATAVVADFPARFQQCWMDQLSSKMGLTEHRPDDAQLAADLLSALHDGQADFTLAFVELGKLAAEQVPAEDFLSLFSDPAVATAWVERWQARCAAESIEGQTRAQRMAAVNPAIIPRNHRVEEALQAAVDRGDFAPFMALHDALSSPFDVADRHSHYALPPEPGQPPYRTFCGT